VERRIDVLVLGGGPAGAALALILARAGRSVVVLERSRYELVRFGESLPPAVRPMLTALGAWDRIAAAGVIASPGLSSAWGDSVLRGVDHLFNPFGPGWHVDRRALDAALADTAEAAGACVQRGAQLRACQWDAPGEWRVEAKTAEHTCLRLRAAVAVDATGRSAWLARRQGARRVIHDRLAALVASVLTTPDAPGRDRRTLVEAVENGWWYAALLPDGRQSLAFLTDVDLVPRDRPLSAVWCDWLERSAFVRRRVAAPMPTTAVRVVSANTSCLDRAAGSNWLALGDAAAAFDPLASNGVYFALGTAAEGAEAILKRLAGATSLSAYAGEVRRHFRAYLRTRATYYGLESRWAEWPFWARRRAPLADD
jgi:flavin-dependent dehydrogenase